MNKAVFFDRDGVVNIEKNYVYKIEDFKFIEGIFDVCKHCIDRGYFLFIITNQAGIARGYYTLSDYEVLTSWMLDQLTQKEIRISKVYHCPHHPDFTGPCTCRKPEPGMLLRAKKEFDIDLENSILIGDKIIDIEAGRNAGIKHLFFYRENIVDIDRQKLKDVAIINNLLDIKEQVR